MVENNLPNFIIAGVNKAGTTSVFQYLKGHPQVCTSLDKETCYFLPLRYGDKPAEIEEYKKQFVKCGNQKYIIEATPGYFYGGHGLADEINSTVQKDCKILIILREPVSRLISFYRSKKKSLELDRNIDFKTYVNYCLSMSEQNVRLKENNRYTGVWCGFYIDFVEHWFNIFNGRIKIAFYDELKNNSKQFMIELSQWLDIDTRYFDGYNFEIENKSFEYKNRLMQSVALKVNKNASRFWRQNAPLKKMLRRIYFKINQSKTEEIIDKENLDMAFEIYKPYNIKLKSFLLEKKIDSLPEWLLKAEPGLIQN